MLVSIVKVLAEQSVLSLVAPLNYLKHLTVKTWLEDVELFGLACFLRSSPNLESLFIYIDDPGDLDSTDIADLFVLDEGKFWESQPLQFYDLLNSLKKVKIKGFEAQGNEIEFIKFLLKNAMVLEELVISTADLNSRYASVIMFGHTEQLMLLQEQQKDIQNLLAFPRASPIAKIYSLQNFGNVDVHF
uniref:FBD domain-containing protein n=1 Tax=Nelumbo nucifera TaxID=4432 RepID=A0A822Z2X0_NELNU|nr:TPA_asm: hypothetical protein HUJ06_013695 [Nelumbo nucifera]